MENKEKSEMIEKHSLRSWFKSCLLGFLIGIAVIVPGISGSTIAIIFKLYDKLLYAVSKLFKKFMLCFLFLLPIVVGAVLGFFLGFLGIRELLALAPFVIICLFAGLMIGAFPAVKDEIKNEKPTKLRVALLVLGIFIPIAIGIFSALFTSAESADVTRFASIEWWEYLLFIVVGYVVAITQVVPGLSATAVLMAIGYFTPLMESFHRDYWAEKPEIFGVYAALIVGFLVGLFTFSKFLTYLFHKARTTTYYFIVGLSCGSIASMFFNPDTYAIYQDWANGATSIKWELPVGIVLIAVGMTLSYLFVRYERKKEIEKISKDTK